MNVMNKFVPTDVRPHLPNALFPLHSKPSSRLLAPSAQKAMNGKNCDKITIEYWQAANFAVTEKGFILQETISFSLWAPFICTGYVKE